MTRCELENFIRYLREKEEVVIDPYIVRTLFVSQMDLTDEVRFLVSKIRKVESDEAAYRALAIKLGYANSENKLFPSILFREDFYEHLLESGFSEEAAEALAAMVANGGYKAFCKRNPKEIPLEGNLHLYAMACHRLPCRDKVAELLRTEYEAFKSV